MNCEDCKYRILIGPDRIDCENSTAAPRTASYPGSGAHPLGFDPAIVQDCNGWEPVLAIELEPAVVTAAGGMPER